MELAKKENNMSDKDFFGVWDKSNKKWSREGKINYSYNDQLKSIGEYVKKGEYEKAKKEIFKYYKKKCNTDDSLEKLKTNKRKNGSKFLLEIWSEGIYSITSPLTSKKISKNRSWNTFSVDKVIKNKLGNDVKQISFMLMSRYKGDNIAKFNSREAEENPPILEISVDGEKKEYTAVSDTYIRAGKYSEENFGKEKQLFVRDSGVPVDNNNMRSYIQFNIDELSSNCNLKSAVLKLYGKAETNEDEMEVLLFNSEQPIVDENNKNWSNSNIKVYSWNKNKDEFEWNDQPAAGQHWIEIVTRFWRQMGFVGAYEKTGNEFYAKEFIDLLKSFINKCGGGELLKDPSNRTSSLNCGSRLQHLVVAYFTLINSEHMNYNLNTEILKFFWAEIEFLNHPDTFWNSHACNNNWGMNQTTAQIKALALFSEFKDFKRWFKEIKSKMRHMLNNFVLDDGTYIEATNGYSEGILSRFLYNKELIDINNISLLDNFDQKLVKFAKYFMNCLEPNWRLTEYGDDHYEKSDSTLKNLCKIGKVYDVQELIYAGSKGAEGTKPSHTSIYFPHGKLAVQRDGWNKESLFLFTNVRPCATHCHNDDLHITLNAYGRRLLVDTSQRSYNDNDDIANWQRKSRGSHNVLDVDKKTVYTKWSATNTDKITANGNMVSNKFFDLFSGYHQEEWSEKEIMKQTRNILFIKPAGFWIVSDYVKVPAGEHEFYQNWHFDSKAEIVIDEKNKKTYSRYKQGPNLLIVPAEPKAITGRIESGFIGSKPHKYITYQKQENGDITYDTILYPFRGKVTPSKVEINRKSLDVPLTEATCLTVKIKESDNLETGYYYHNYKAVSGNKEFDKFETDATTVYIHKNNVEITMLSLYSARYLKYKGETIIESSKEIDNIGIIWDKDSLEISSAKNCIEDKGELMIKVQDKIRQVIYNGQKVEYKQKEGYIFI